MAGRRRLHNDVRIDVEDYDSGHRTRLSRQRHQGASFLRPSEQLRRHRYESSLLERREGAGSYAGNSAAIYANLLEIQERTVKTPEVDGNTAYKDIFEHLHDVLQAGQMLRQLPLPMDEKKKLLKLVTRFEVRNINALSRVDGWKFSLLHLRLAAKRHWNNFTGFLTPFGGMIKTVERSHGSGVASYFLFLRSLLGLNIFLFILMLGFVILPQAFVGTGLEIPENAKNGSELSLVLDGKGYLMEYSLLFYGFYDNVIWGSNPGYSLPIAYFVTTGAVLVLSFLILAGQLLGKGNVVVSTAKRSMPFSWYALVSWDYNITDCKASADHSATITDKIKKTIQRHQQNESGIRTSLLFARIAVNFLVACLLAGSVCAIYITVVSARCILLTSQDLNFDLLEQGTAGIGKFFSVIRVPLVVSSLNILLPFFFEMISQWNWEKLHPRTYLALTIVRSSLLYFANFIVLLVSLFIQMTSDPTMGNIEDIRCCLSAVSSQDSIAKAVIERERCCLDLSKEKVTSLASQSACCYNNLSNSNPSVIEKFSCLATIGPQTGHQPVRCWETLVGQELFKLVFVDLILEIGFGILIAELLRGLLAKTGWFKCCDNKLKFATFSTSQNVLSLVYQQSVAWFGTLFCPFLLGITAAGHLIILFLRTLMCKWFIRPQKIFRNFRSSTRNYHTSVLLVMLLVNLFAVGYVVVEMVPSNGCGPFRTMPDMGTVLVREIEGWASWLVKAIDYLKSAAVIFILVLLLCALAYYQWCQARAYREFQKDLLYQMKVLRSRINLNGPESRLSTLHPALSRLALTTPDGDVRSITLPRVLPAEPPPKERLEAIAIRHGGRPPKQEPKPKDKKRQKERRGGRKVDDDECGNFNDAFDEIYGSGNRGSSNTPVTPRVNVKHHRQTTDRYAHVTVPDYMVGTEQDPLLEDEMPDDFFRNPLSREETYF